MGLITNGAVDSQQPKIDGLGIARYFDTMLISEAEGVAKPDAEIFRRATDNLGVSPDQAVMIGDNPEADIRGAKSCRDESDLETRRVLGGHLRLWMR